MEHNKFKEEYNMKMAQNLSEKEAIKQYEIEKTMALTVFKKYWPAASIVFYAPKEIEPIVEPEPEGPSEEELLAIKVAEEKAAKKAELEAALKALDDS